MLNCHWAAKGWGQVTALYLKKQKKQNRLRKYSTSRQSSYLYVYCTDWCKMTHCRYPTLNLKYSHSQKHYMSLNVTHKQTKAQSEWRSDREAPLKHWVSVMWLQHSLLGRGVRRLPPLFREAVWLSLPRADVRVSPSRSRAPTPTDIQNKSRERVGEGQKKERLRWIKLKERETHTSHIK